MNYSKSLIHIYFLLQHFQHFKYTGKRMITSKTGEAEAQRCFVKVEGKYQRTGHLGRHRAAAVQTNHPEHMKHSEMPNYFSEFGVKYLRNV